MLREIRRLEDTELHAREGQVGRIKDVYFDDELWHLRYFVVDTGSWLTGRTVLIAPSSVKVREWEERRLMTDLTRDQVRNSPNLDAAKPVSRQHEQELHNYYAWPFYWGEPPKSRMYVRSLAPATPSLANASGATAPGDRPAPAVDERGEREHGSHLRSARAIRGYPIAATDRSIGHLDDLVVDDETWAVRHLVVDTRNWWPGKKVILAFSQIRGMSWSEEKIYVNATSDAIKASPEFDSGRPIESDYVDRLDAHYHKGTS